MATLINGNLNSPVYAAQDADLIAAICGNKTVITPVGNQFAHELEDANTIKVDDGVIITKEGRRIQLDAGDIDEFLIPTGTQGQTNYYLCGYHLYTDEQSAELCETFVEPAASASETITEDTFRSGSTEVYVTLFRVTQEGLTITAITDLISKSGILEDAYKISDAASTTINDNDYIPMATNNLGTKKKTLFSTLKTKLLGNTDISSIGSTITAAISALNTSLSDFKTNNDGAHIKMQISTQAYDDSAVAGKYNVCQWNGGTNDTPYKSGLTAFGNGIIMTYKISEQYYTQLAMAVGDTNIFSRRCDNGSWSAWEIIGGKTSTDSATFNSGITINSQTLRKRGSIVVFGFNLYLPTTSSDTVIGTLPIGYRPSADIYGIAEKNNPNVDTIEQGFCIKTNGDIQLTNASSGGICRGSITFII